MWDWDARHQVIFAFNHLPMETKSFIPSLWWPIMDEVRSHYQKERKKKLVWQISSSPSSWNGILTPISVPDSRQMPGHFSFSFRLYCLPRSRERERESEGLETREKDCFQAWHLLRIWIRESLCVRVKPPFKNKFSLVSKPQYQNDFLFVFSLEFSKDHWSFGSHCGNATLITVAANILFFSSILFLHPTVTRLFLWLHQFCFSGPKPTTQFLFFVWSCKGDFCACGHFQTKAIVSTAFFPSFSHCLCVIEALRIQFCTVCKSSLYGK